MNSDLTFFSKLALELIILLAKLLKYLFAEMRAFGKDKIERMIFLKS